MAFLKLMLKLPFLKPSPGETFQGHISATFIMSVFIAEIGVKL